MRRAGQFVCLAMLACAVLSPAAKAEVLAQYTYVEGNPNPDTQGWTWNGIGTIAETGASLHINEATGDPSFLFTKTVTTNALFDAWSFTGQNRYAGNSQEELTMMMFVDDGTNLWHMSFRNSANQFDGIYINGDPTGPGPGAVTATFVYPEHPFGSGPGPFDDFHDWTLQDPDGMGGEPPIILLDGTPLELLEPLTPAPSMFAAGTVGWGSVNIFEAGHFQTRSMIFDGNPNAMPPAGLQGDFNGNQVVDAADFVVWRKNLGAADESSLRGNGDGMNGVDQGDYTLWQMKFGSTPGGGSGAALAAVPEPHSLALLTIGIMGAMATRWRVIDCAARE